MQDESYPQAPLGCGRSRSTSLERMHHQVGARDVTFRFDYDQGAHVQGCGQPLRASATFFAFSKPRTISIVPEV